MPRTRQYIGRLGEKLAAKFLTSRGFSILSRNFPTPFGEIDLVAERDGFIVFLEVKTRTSEKFGEPLCSITGTKRKHIIKNCQFYLKRYGLFESACRIDAIGIILDEFHRLKTLRYIKNAIEV